MNEPLKIFIVDNSRMFIRTLEKALKSEQWEIESATSASAGLMRILRWHPRLLISGVEVGDINGFDLCEICKRMPDFSGMPVIIISSTTTKQAQRQAADAGADFFLHKSADVVENLGALLRTKLGAECPPAAPARVIQRVLLVDDSKVMRQIIRNILAGVGISQVVEAGNGEQALKQLELGPVDLVMTDWNMPIMNGLEFTKAVRRHSRLAATPIVMVTTEGGKRALAEAEAAGIDGHLCKPFSHETMRAFIARFTGGRKR